MPGRKRGGHRLPAKVRRIYDSLRRKRGYSKAKSAAIAYAVVNHTINRRSRRGRR